jgi:hypothetical protein
MRMSRVEEGWADGHLYVFLGCGFRCIVSLDYAGLF